MRNEKKKEELCSRATSTQCVRFRAFKAGIMKKKRSERANEIFTNVLKSKSMQTYSALKFLS
jgi:hypothetical protein